MISPHGAPAQELEGIADAALALQYLAVLRNMALHSADYQQHRHRQVGLPAPARPTSRIPLPPSSLASWHGVGARPSIARGTRACCSLPLLLPWKVAIATSCPNVASARVAATWQADMLGAAQELVERAEELCACAAHVGVSCACREVQLLEMQRLGLELAQSAETDSA